MRRLGALVRGLPASSRVHQQEQGGWSTIEHLLATLVEEVREQTRWMVAGTPWKHPRPQVPPPLHIPRPGEVHTGERKTWLQLARAMGGMRKRRR